MIAASVLPVLAYPAIDPVLIEIGPIAIRWYSLAYIAGLLLGVFHMRRLAAASPAKIDPAAIEDFLVWATLGVVLGGRLGQVLFYQPGYYFADPVQILMVWKGGMAFHGGLLGVVLATWLFCRRRGIDVLAFGDLIACASPIGLFFGRIANFINGELWGRPTDVPWAMVFPRAGPDPRHPSQLYEATLEGVVLFVLLALLWRNENLRRRRGLIAGVFLVGYGSARIVAEFFRNPDVRLDFLFEGASLGQLLSLPMVLIGLWLVRRAKPATAE